MQNKIKNYFLLLTGILIYLSYFLSYFLNENSIGSGGYNGDLTWIWKNFEIFKSNDFLSSIKSKEFFGNRTPLFYLINIYFNPFIDTIDGYRLSVFIFFTLTPIIFFFTLQSYFQDKNFYILFSISTLILLSPYFRSSAVWAQEINYGILTLVTTFLFFIKFKKKENFFNLFFTTLFSSLCIYFDQKLLIVPLFCFIYIIFKSNLNLKSKLFSSLLYFIFSLPYLYLIILWGGIVPPLTQMSNNQAFNSIENFNLHFYHLGFAATMIALYLVPVILLKEEINYKKIKFFFNQNYLKILLPLLLYLFIYIYFDWYDVVISKQYTTVSGGSYGLGFANKLSILFFDNINLRELFIYFAFTGAWLIILYALDLKATNWILIIYFFILSIILLPIMQEYFDPYIFLLSILMNTKNNFIFSFYRTMMASLYLGTALSFAIFYY